MATDEQVQQAGGAATEAPSDEEHHVENVAAPSPEDERVRVLLEKAVDVPLLAEAVEQQEAADAADTLEHLEQDEAADVLVAMDDRFAAQALAEMERPLAVAVIRDLIDEKQADYASNLLDLMAPDDAADLLQSIDENQRETLLAAMPATEAIRLRRLVGYDEESAAGLMTTEHVALRDDMTVGEATEVLRSSRIPEEMFHLPVVDRERHLVGIINLRTLLLNRAERRISDLITQTPKAIHAECDREAVAREFDRYDLYMLPVIDHADRLLGIITVDDVIDIIREEQTEDVQMTVGAGKGEAVYSGIAEKFRGRFPWLVTSLVMTCFAAFVVLFFEELIREHPILAFLMPVIAALVGNAGHQALAVTLRGIVLEEVRRERVWPLVLREGAVGLVNGMALGVLMVVVVTTLAFFTVSASWKVGVVAGSALIVCTAVGTLAGSGIPLVMRRVGVDPAQASAIFLIMITDAVAFATFLGLTSLSRGWLER